MEQKAGAQISREAVVQSLLILVGLMLAAGILLFILVVIGCNRQSRGQGYKIIT